MANNSNIRKAATLWFCTAGYMVLIFFLSSRTFSSLDLPGNSDKIIHMLVYAFLAFLFYISLMKSGFIKYIFAAAVLLTVIYGITDEIHQSFVPGRDASAGDAVADLAGALLGSFMARFVIIQRGWLPALYNRN